MNNATPSAASLLINSCTPTERAVLYNSMLIVKNYYENELDSLDKHVMQAYSHKRMSEYFRWHIKHCNEVMNKLFAECFPDDLEPLKYFSQELPPVKKVVMAMAG